VLDLEPPRKRRWSITTHPRQLEQRLAGSITCGRKIVTVYTVLARNMGV
jgi:hypothetical protein